MLVKAAHSPLVKSQWTVSLPKAGSAGQVAKRGLQVVEVWADTRAGATRARAATERALENIGGVLRLVASWNDGTAGEGWVRSRVSNVTQWLAFDGCQFKRGGVVRTHFQTRSCRNRRPIAFFVVKKRFPC